MINTYNAKTNLEKINFIIISIFPLLLISGPFFSEIGMFFIIFSYLYFSKQELIIKNFFKKFLIIYLFFF